jgi:hypothetical protein
MRRDWMVTEEGARLATDERVEDDAEIEEEERVMMGAAEQEAAEVTVLKAWRTCLSPARGAFSAVSEAK